MAKLLSQLKYLFVGVDESSKGDGRSFVEVEFGGFKEKQPSQGKKVFFPVIMKEVLGHTAQDMCTLILECLQDNQAKQQELGLAASIITKLYHFKHQHRMAGRNRDPCPGKNT